VAHLIERVNVNWSKKEIRDAKIAHKAHKILDEHAAQRNGEQA